jgi:hypothetical protein
MLGGGISPDAEHGRCGTGAGEGACWICGESRVSRGIAGSGGGSRRRWRSRRSGAAAAIGGAGAGSEGQGRIEGETFDLVAGFYKNAIGHVQSHGP